MLKIFLFFVASVWGGAVSAKAEALPEEADQRFVFSRLQLGTRVQIIFYAQPDFNGKELADRCFKKVTILENIFSDYREDSELSLICSQPSGIAYPVSEDLFKVLSCAVSVTEKTGGAFDLTLGKWTRSWREKKKKNSSQELDAPPKLHYQNLVLNQEKQTVLLKKELQLDLGGIAKGYIADELMLLLKAENLKRAAVIVGGETVLSDPPLGAEGWPVALEGPDKELVKKLSLRNRCYSVSGESYQFLEHDGGRFSHVLNPLTGEGQSDRLNVFVLAPSAMEADVWATAFRVLGKEKSQEIAANLKGIEAFFVAPRSE